MNPRIKLIGGSSHGTDIIANPITIKAVVVNGEMYVTDQVQYFGVEQYRYVGKASDDK